MEASRVILSREIREKLNNPMLDEAKRRKLKRERVLDCIRNLEGQPVSIRVLMAAAGYDDSDHKQYVAGAQYINALRKRGVIITYDRTFKKRWFVAEVTDQKPKREPKPKAEDQPTLDIEERAKEFAWVHESDSLREFVKWLKTFHNKD